jgi:hypothetical protein
MARVVTGNTGPDVIGVEGVGTGVEAGGLTEPVPYGTSPALNPLGAPVWGTPPAEDPVVQGSSTQTPRALVL